MMQTLRRFLRSRKGTGAAMDIAAILGGGTVVLVTVLAVMNGLSSTTQKAGQSASAIVDIETTDTAISQIVSTNCPYDQSTTPPATIPAGKSNDKTKCYEDCGKAYEGFEKTITQCKGVCDKRCG